MMKPSIYAYLGAFYFCVLAVIQFALGQPMDTYLAAMLLSLILAKGYNQEGR